MDKIVIFIIIMIVSSFLNKKKKKAKESKYVEKTKTTYFDSKGNKVSSPNKAKPVTSLKEVFSAFDTAINKSKDRSQAERFEKYKTKKEQRKNEYAFDSMKNSQDKLKNSQDQLKYSQDSITNSVDDLAFSQDSMSNSMDKYRDSEKYNERKFSYDNATSDEPLFQEQKKQKKRNGRNPLFNNLLNSKNKLKQAVVLSEIINRKY